MTRTLREYCMSFILIGIMVIVGFVLMPFFGPQPLSNPIAVGILLTVMIISCCLLSMNQVIIAKFKTTKDSNILCPYCHSVIKSKAISCPQCGNILRSVDN